MNIELTSITAVILGGMIGFLSSFLTQRLNEKNLRRQLTIPNQINAIECVSLTIFHLLSGDELSLEDHDKYIKACFWLDRDNSKYLQVLEKKDDNEYLKEMQLSILQEYETIKTGDRPWKKKLWMFSPKKLHQEKQPKKPRKEKS